LSALKNKFDLDKREQNKSVVQRFISPEIKGGEEPGEAEAVLPQAEEKIPVISVPAEPEFKDDAKAVAAQLERLESRLERFESKISGLDKLDKLDELTNLEQLNKLDKLNGLDTMREITPKYILFNAMEEAVREEVKATISNVNICRCDKCYYDICALVLNNLPPQYVTSQEGVLFKKAAALLSMETLTKISGDIFDAISKVKNNPSH